MRKQLFLLITLLALFMAALPLNAAPQGPDRNSLDRSILRSAHPALDGEDALELDNLLSELSGRVEVVVELSDTPATEVYALELARPSISAEQATARAAAVAQQHLAQIESAQRTLQTRLESPAIGAKVLYRTQRVFNGIAVRVDAEKIDQIRELPGVTAVFPLIPHELDNSTSVPLIGAPALWEPTGLQATGRNIRVGIIDTGIDYIHTNFGGSGQQEDYDVAEEDEESPFFPSAKVVGGWDFVGDLYQADCTPRQEEAGECTAEPQPDPNPMDCHGHGTHVAGTAAGFGVNAGGSTYEGPYGPDTPFDELRIGPGVAPEADLYALKVFGCAGSTNVTNLAIEWAVDPNGDGDFSDRLDVINMSLGSQYGTPFDPTAIASDNAASIGMIVVASAGNSGDTYYITGSPAVSGRTISVASSADSTMVMDGFRVNSPPSIAGIKPALFSINYSWGDNPPVTGDLVYPPTQRSGCEPFNEANQVLLAGKIALLDWTKIGETHECGSATRVNNAANAGAIGVIMVYPETIIDIAIGGSPRIPAVITPSSVGDQLKAHLDEGINVTLSEEFGKTQRVIIPELTDTLSDFSSRGPRRVDSALKPDISAPGQTIFSAQALTGNQGVSFNGTSMAAPHVAGSMALLRQLHPDWSVEELKALAMNTANNDLRSDLPPDAPIVGPGRVGAGRITLTDAALSPVIAYNASSPTEQGLVSVSFGAPEVVGNATATRTIRVTNKSNQPLGYNIAYRPVVDTPGVSYSLSTNWVLLPEYGSANIVVTMTADASQMKHTHDQTVDETQATLPRHWLTEEAGYVVLTSNQANPPLRVPVYAAPRPASDMRALSNTIGFEEGATESTISLVGQDVFTVEEDDQGEPDLPYGEVSLVTAFELQHSSPNDIRSIGIFDNADLKYIGVASDFEATGVVSETLLSFGIATHGNWSSPNEVQFNVFIDTNRDGTPDFRLLNVDIGRATGATANDVFITVLANLNTGEVTLQNFLNGVPASAANTVPFNTNVMVLPVNAADLGLTDTNATFDYRIVTVSLGFEEEDTDLIVNDLVAVDSTPMLTYNAAAPGLDLSGGEEGVPAYFDLSGGSIPVSLNQEAFEAAGSQGVLLLHHHNATPDRRAEVLRIETGLGAPDTPRTTVYFPFFPNAARR
jgi:subtilisin family serine protease